MKKSISIFVFALLLSGTAWAQATAPSAEVWPNVTTDIATTIMTPFDGAKSVVTDASKKLFSSDVDNFFSLTNYKALAFDKLFLFLGGATVDGALTGGAATKIGGNYLAFYTSGNLFPKSGSASIPNDDDLSDNTVYEDNKFQWENVFSVLWGNAAVGGLRFDLQFNDSTPNSNNTAKEGVTQTKNQPFVTALRWSGLNFGGFALRPTLAFQWPGYTKKTTAVDTGDFDSTQEKWENAELDVKLDAAYGTVLATYEILVDFGTTQKGDIDNPSRKGYEAIYSGYAVHTLALNYTATYDADEKIQFKAKPKLTMNLYTKSDTSKVTLADTDPVETDDGTTTAFRLTPALDLGVSWKLLPKLTLYTGTTVTPFILTTSSTTKGDDNSSSVDKKQSYLATGSIGSLSFGLEFNPAPALGFEFGLDNIGSGGSEVDLSAGTYAFNPVMPSGKFLVKVRL
jgi:hypothetical protein